MLLPICLNVGSIGAGSSSYYWTQSWILICTISSKHSQEYDRLLWEQNSYRSPLPLTRRTVLSQPYLVLPNATTYVITAFTIDLIIHEPHSVGHGK